MRSAGLKFLRCIYTQWLVLCEVLLKLLPSTNDNPNYLNCCTLVQCSFITRCIKGEKSPSPLTLFNPPSVFPLYVFKYKLYFDIKLHVQFCHVYNFRVFTCTCVYLGHNIPSGPTSFVLSPSRNYLQALRYITK